MDVSKRTEKFKSLFLKYRFPALILLVGVVLMMLPSFGQKQQTVVDHEEIREEVAKDEALAEILSTIEGAGKVQVLLSIAAGEETVYQTDQDSSYSNETTSTKITTITVTGSDKTQRGLVRQVNPPVYLGAIVTCQGADRASVRLAIVDAVSKVTGLGADCIAVLKMK